MIDLSHFLYVYKKWLKSIIFVMLSERGLVKESGEKSCLSWLFQNGMMAPLWFHLLKSKVLFLLLTRSIKVVY